MGNVGASSTGRVIGMAEDAKGIGGVESEGGGCNGMGGVESEGGGAIGIIGAAGNELVDEN